MRASGLHAGPLGAVVSEFVTQLVPQQRVDGG